MGLVSSENAANRSGDPHCWLIWSPPESICGGVNLYLVLLSAKWSEWSGIILYLGSLVAEQPSLALSLVSSPVFVVL